MTEAREALLKAQEALNTWAALYAPVEAGDDAFNEARERITGIGTLAYIADTNRVINAALASLSEPGWREALEKIRDTYKASARFADLDYANAYREFVRKLDQVLSASPKPASPAPAGVEAKCPDCDGHGDRNIADATFIPCVTCLLAALKELHQAVDAEMGDTDADDRLTRAMGDAARLLALHCGEQWGDFEFRDERDDPANINNAFARGEEVER